MDHILENESNPVPDLSAVSSSSSGSRAQPMDVDDDDEDAEALRALTGKAGVVVSSGAAAEAKVSIWSKINVRHPPASVGC
jgi:UBX domain-containing protein 1/4